MKIFIIAFIVIFGSSAYAQQEIRKQPAQPSVDGNSNATKSVSQGQIEGRVSFPIRHQSQKTPNLSSPDKGVAPPEPQVILQANHIAPAPISFRNGVQEKTIAVPIENKTINAGSRTVPIEHSVPGRTEQK